MGNSAHLGGRDKGWCASLEQRSLAQGLKDPEPHQLTMAAPVVHFEIHASDRPALMQFYADVFGWSGQPMEGMDYTVLMPMQGENPEDPPPEGIGGGMMDRQGPVPDVGAPVNGFVCVLQVNDLEATRAAVAKHGGVEAVPPFDIEGVGRAYYFRDPDNNLVGAMQPA